MPGLEDLYREIILDHYRNPRNRGELPAPPAHVETGFNPLCGDEITLYVDIDDGRIKDLRLGGQGCSISQSSASMMSTAVKGKTVEEARATVRTFKRMMSVHEHRLDGSEDNPDSPAEPEVPLGDLEALQGVVKFPVRIKCATLSWNTLVQALDSTADASAAGALDRAAGEPGA
ncbi:MAG TPA: SUF system NifU family Fe-S cluster assembly protein [Acidimicrobiales bacterium]